MGLLLPVLPRARFESRNRTIAARDASARGSQAHEVLGVCGSRKIDARPELYPGGVVAMRRRFRENPPTG